MLHKKSEGRVTRYDTDADTKHCTVPEMGVWSTNKGASNWILEQDISSLLTQSIFLSCEYEKMSWTAFFTYSFLT